MLWSKSKTSRYWTDPEYRARKLRQAAEFRKRHRNDPQYKRIRYLESAVQHRKNSIEMYQQRILRLEKSLCALTRELVKARDKWKKFRESENSQ